VITKLVAALLHQVGYWIFKVAVFSRLIQRIGISKFEHPVLNSNFQTPKTKQVPDFKRRKNTNE
jgi:hypothetical protein